MQSSQYADVAASLVKSLIAKWLATPLPNDHFCAVSKVDSTSISPVQVSRIKTFSLIFQLLPSLLPQCRLILTDDDLVYSIFMLLRHGFIADGEQNAAPVVEFVPKYISYRSILTMARALTQCVRQGGLHHTNLYSNSIRSGLFTGLSLRVKEDITALNRYLLFKQFRGGRPAIDYGFSLSRFLLNT